MIHLNKMSVHVIKEQLYLLFMEKVFYFILSTQDTSIFKKETLKSRFYRKKRDY